jgi:1,2-diacylglycerol 3-beta-galactosyltransferase
MDRAPRRGQASAHPASAVSETPGGPAPSVLLLFSDTGGGHRAAARALAEAIHLTSPAAEVELFDPLIGHGPPVVRRLAGLYPSIIQRARPAWGPIYYSSNTRPAWAMLRTTFGGRVREIVLRELRRRRPDLIISVHPLFNHEAAAALMSGPRPRATFVTVVTDLVELHRGWSSRRVDLIVVPTQAARQQMLRRGIRADRLLVVGLPVALDFHPPAPGEREQGRGSLGLDPHRTTLLLAAGGEGSAGLLRQVLALSSRDNPWQVIVVCGRNEAVRSRILEQHLQTPTRVLGFVDNMPELMRAADLVIGKAGPGAIVEALATGVPLILTTYLPGQETPNVGYVLSRGVGLYVPKAERLPVVVQGLLAGDGAELRRMTRRAAGIVKPGAAINIIDAAMQLMRNRTGAELR